MRRKHKSKRIRKMRREQEQTTIPTVRVRRTGSFLLFCGIRDCLSEIKSLEQCEWLLEQLLENDFYKPYRIIQYDDQVVKIVLRKRVGLKRKQVSLDSFAYTSFNQWARRMIALYEMERTAKRRITSNPDATKW